MQGEKNSRKSKQKNKCIKNNNRIKKLKLKREGKKKGKLHRTAKVQQRQRFITIKNVTEIKKRKKKAQKPN